MIPFVDYSFGGAINVQGFTTLNVTHSGFGYNQAVGGNNATATGGDIVGVGGAEGGAILGEVGTTVNFSDCTFAHNQAIGGNGNSGSGPVILVGEGIGGAIISGYGGDDLGPNTVTVSNCSLTSELCHGRRQQQWHCQRRGPGRDWCRGWNCEPTPAGPSTSTAACSTGIWPAAVRATRPGVPPRSSPVLCGRRHFQLSG